jgi:hypothetical protein
MCVCAKNWFKPIFPSFKPEHFIRFPTPSLPAVLFAIAPLYPTAQKPSVGQVYRVHTLSRYSRVCAVSTHCHGTAGSVLNNTNISRAHYCLHLPLHLLYVYHWRSRNPPTSLATITKGLFVHTVTLCHLASFSDCFRAIFVWHV